MPATPITVHIDHPDLPVLSLGARAALKLGDHIGYVFTGRGGRQFWLEGIVYSVDGPHDVTDGEGDEPLEDIILTVGTLYANVEGCSIAPHIVTLDMSDDVVRWDDVYRNALGHNARQQRAAARTEMILRSMGAAVESMNPPAPTSPDFPPYPHIVGPGALEDVRERRAFDALRKAAERTATAIILASPFGVCVAYEDAPGLACEVIRDLMPIVDRDRLSPGMLGRAIGEGVHTAWVNAGLER